MVKVVLLEGSLMNFILGISKEMKWKVKGLLPEVSLMKFILGISKEIKWLVKVVLFEVSMMNFTLWIFKEIKWKVIKRFTGSIIDELNSKFWDVQGDQMEG